MSSSSSSLRAVVRGATPEILAGRIRQVKVNLNKRNLGIKEIKTFIENGSYVAYLTIAAHAEMVAAWQAAEIPRIQAAVRRLLFHRKAWLLFANPRAIRLQAAVRRSADQFLYHYLREATMTVQPPIRRCLARNKYTEFLTAHHAELRRIQEEKERREEEERQRIERETMAKLKAEQARREREAEWARQEEERKLNEEKAFQYRMDCVCFLQAVVRRVDANKLYVQMLMDLWDAENKAANDVESVHESVKNEPVQEAEAEDAATMDATVNGGGGGGGGDPFSENSPFMENESSGSSRVSVSRSLRMANLWKARQKAEQNLMALKNRCQHLSILEHSSISAAKRMEKTLMDLGQSRVWTQSRKERVYTSVSAKEQELELNRHQNIVKEWRRKYSIEMRKTDIAKQRKTDARTQKGVTMQLLQEKKVQQQQEIETAKLKAAQVKEDHAKCVEYAIQRKFLKEQQDLWDYSVRESQQQDFIQHIMSAIDFYAKEEESLMQRLAFSRQKESSAMEDLARASTTQLPSLSRGASVGLTYATTTRTSMDRLLPSRPLTDRAVTTTSKYHRSHRYAKKESAEV